jgi:tetratricopeptide (TPR) repeat protein
LNAPTSPPDSEVPSTSVPRASEDVVLEQAVRSCDERLQQDPNQPDLLHTRAGLAIKEGRYQFAFACLLHAIELDSSQAAYFRDLGDMWLRKGRDVDALAAHTRAVELAPDDPDCHSDLGRVFVLRHQFEEAVAAYERALRLDPKRADIYVELGNALYMKGADDDVARAFAEYGRAIEIDPSEAGAHNGLARIHAERGEWDEALGVLYRGEQCAPRAVELYVTEAEVHLRPDGGDPSSAIDPLEVALHINPRYVPARCLYVETLRRLNRHEDLAEALCGLGVALETPGTDKNLAEAWKAYDEVVTITPDCLLALLKRGDLALKLRHPEAAIECFEAALAADPNQPFAHTKLGEALLITGEFTRGWSESAWKYATGNKPRFEQPLWDGSPLCGRTLLLWAEPAPGDTIQHLRFLPFAKLAAAAVLEEETHERIIVECDKHVVSLVDSMTGVGIITVVANDAPLPAFDVHLPLGRLPEMLDLDIAITPSRVPYLRVNPDHEVAWRERLGLGRDHSIESAESRDAPDGRDKRHEHARDVTVGLVWSGDTSRGDTGITSASLMDFEPLAHVKGVRFISLQLGPGAAELVVPPAGLRVERILDESCGATDTAAVMNNLDLIITVDSMAAHMAGALGRPTWVLATCSPAWWLWDCDGDHTYWYPTMRVFRQEGAGDWGGVMKRVAETLERFVLPAV